MSCQWQPSFDPCRGGGAAKSGVPVINTCCLMTAFKRGPAVNGKPDLLCKNQQAGDQQRGVSSSKQKFGFTLSTSAGGFAALILCMRTDSSSSSSSSGSLPPLLSAPAHDMPYKLLFVELPNESHSLWLSCNVFIHKLCCTQAP